MLSLGFTGTRVGMNARQKAILSDLLNARDYSEYHHGDCIGADAQFHFLVMQKLRQSNLLNLVKEYVFIHPPDNYRLRAFCEDGFKCAERSYLDRNKDIVESCDLLVAVPNHMGEFNKIRSGTWYTVRYAKKLNKDIIIIV